MKSFSTPCSIIYLYTSKLDDDIGAGQNISVLILTYIYYTYLYDFLDNCIFFLYLLSLDAEGKNWNFCREPRRIGRSL